MAYHRRVTYSHPPISHLPLSSSPIPSTASLPSFILPLTSATAPVVPVLILDPRIMDQANSHSIKHHRKPSTRLHKNPPQLPSSSSWFIKKQTSTTSLQRHPSAPVYPRSHNSSSREHSRTKSSAHGSSSSSLDQQSSRQSPVFTAKEFGTSSSTYAPPPSRPQYTPPLSCKNKSSDELIASPFDARGMLNAQDSIKPEDQTQSPRRPPVLHSYSTSPDPRSTPKVAQTATFTSGGSLMDTSPTLAAAPGENGTASSKRYSDDSNGAKVAMALRKKTGFSNFMNSVLGSPRSIKISAPENPVHVTHVGYDNKTGQFTVCTSFYRSPCMEDENKEDGHLGPSSFYSSISCPVSMCGSAD